MVETPPAAKRCFTSGILRISPTSAESLSMIGCGTPAGARSAVQFDALMSPPPCSCRVGHSGLSGDRLRRGYRQDANAAIRHKWRDGRTCQDSKRDVAGDQSLGGGSPAFERDVHEFGSGFQRDRFQNKLVDAAVARSADIKRLGMRLGCGDDIGDRLVRTGGICCEHDRCIAHRGDRREIAADVIWHSLNNAGLIATSPTVHITSV